MNSKKFYTPYGDVPGIPLLKAIIIFDEKNNASIQFKELHSQLKIPEYIRMVLHFYAKMLVILDPAQPESYMIYTELLLEIDKISTAKLKNNSNILKIADIDDVVKLSKPEKPQYHYIATLFCIANTGIFRHLTTEIPFPHGTYQQICFSVPILIQGVLEHLSEKDILFNMDVEILQLALRKMNEVYKKGFDYSDSMNYESIPINAYVAAQMDNEILTKYKDDVEKARQMDRWNRNV